MTTFNQLLQLEKVEFDRLKVDHKGFNKAPMKEVVQYLRDYKAQMTDSVAYNSKVEEYIKSKENVSEEMADQLGTEVYLAQKFLRDEATAKHTQEMADQGFIPCREWKGYIGKALLKGKISIDWFSGKIDKEGKIIETNDGEDGFFIPKGKRSRGYYLRNLEEAFFKPIS